MCLAFLHSGTVVQKADYSAYYAGSQKCYAAKPLLHVAGKILQKLGKQKGRAGVGADILILLLTLLRALSSARSTNCGPLKQLIK